MVPEMEYRTGTVLSARINDTEKFIIQR
jgi:hypothetical protein